MKYAIAATLVALVMFGVGCHENYTPVGKNQVLVQDGDGGADLNNVAHACHGVQNVAKLVWSHSDDRAALVTCRKAK